MSSPLRSESSRANGAKSRGPVTGEGRRKALANSARSTGPVTPEGKAVSSRNSLRHGLLSDSIVLPNESAQRFDELLASLQTELRPEPGIEAAFVHKMAVAYWRQMRLWCLEKLQFVHETGKQEALNEGADSATCTALAFRALCDETRALELLNRYESRFDRQYQRALANFNAHRDRKRPVTGPVDAPAPTSPSYTPEGRSQPAENQDLPNEVNPGGTARTDT